MSQLQGGPPPPAVISWLRNHHGGGPPPSSWPSSWNHWTTKTSTGAASATASPQLAAGEKDTTHSVSHKLMPAVVVPVVVVALGIIGLCLFLFLRRRKQRQAVPTDEQQPPPEMAMAANDVVREHRAPPTLDVNLPDAPVIISTHNDAYLTGLDTLSQGSQSRRNSEEQADYAPRRSLGGTFAEPPPPYKAGDDPSPEYEIPPSMHDAPPSPIVRSPFGDSQEDIPVADGMMHYRSPFADPESPVSEIASQHVGERRNSDVSEL